MAADVKLVKFVDRTFNCDSDRAFEIWQYLIKRCGENGCRTRFHFEIAADLLDDKAIDLLKTAPEGLLQFEIGVQTCSQEVLRQITDPVIWISCFYDADSCAKGLIHQHLDLIAGLPGGTISSRCLQLRSGYFT
jgi:anaerobic magnesium-protoporphyrin IX monomethyl ester cyclase